MHICGNITHLLPGLASLDLDIIDVDHMVDLRTVRKELGTRTVIAGNIDPVAGVLRSTPDAIRQAVRDCYAQAGNPFMVGAGCEIPSRTPVENLRALCEPVPYRHA
jgi:uroporphyrinogen decarboxylase